MIGFIYGMAVINVVCGAALASLLLLGWLPALQNWPALKPAHAWLNVFGFVSLAIAGSLLHLLPTVAGTRISDSRATVCAYLGIAMGPPIAALGFILGVDALTLAGAVVLVIGALALGVYGLDVVRRSFDWRTDHGWHRFTTWSLVAGIAWFIVGCAIAAWIVLQRRRDCHWLAARSADRPAVHRLGGAGARRRVGGAAWCPQSAPACLRATPGSAGSWGGLRPQGWRCSTRPCC